MATAAIAAPTTANEVLMLFSSALAKPADSQEQASVLEQVRSSIEAAPQWIPVLYSTILSVAPRAGRFLKRWIADVVELVVARLAITTNALTNEQRIHMTVQSVDAILLFLGEPGDVPADEEVQKRGIQCYATAYPVLFRHACVSGSDPRLWEKVVRGKGTVLHLWRNGSTGAKIAAMKAVQKIIQAQTRGSADPRRQDRNDVNIAMCPSHHPFMKAQQLEEEANKLVEEAFSLMYMTKLPDIIASVVNSYTVLVKARPSFGHLIFGALTNWTPASLAALNPIQIKSAEKTIRLALVHLLRSGHGNAHAAQINDFLHRQDQRMKSAWEAEQRRKEQEATHKRQRDAEDFASNAAGWGQPASPSTKRRRLENGMGRGTPEPSGSTGQQRTVFTGNMAIFAGASGTMPPAGIADFDIQGLPLDIVIECIIANLQVVGEQRLNAAIEVSRRRISAGTTTIDSTGAAPPASQGVDVGSGAVKQEDVEGVALDPLKLELDEDDLDRRAQDAQARDQQDRAALDAAEAEATREAGEDGGASGSKADGALTASGSAASITASPMVLAKIKSKLLHAAVDRICAVGMSAAAAVQAGGGDKELWIQLISRLVTRGLPQPGQEREDGTSADGTPALVPEEEEDEGIRKEKESIRKQIYDFVTADLGERIELARLWLNEEWYTESLARRRKRKTSPADPAARAGDADGDGDGTDSHIASTKDTPYARWLRQLLDYISSNAVIDKEKVTSFTQFVVDLPEIPKAELGRLARMCEEPTGMKTGFITLRDLATLRPPLRSDAMDVLLSLTTHADRAIRSSAIVSIKRWVPDTKPLGQMGVDFALHLLSRLEVSPSRQGSVAAAGPGEAMKAEAGVDTGTGEDATLSSAGEGAPVSNPVAKRATVEKGRVISGLPEPLTEAEVAQHIELLFGLVSKSPDLLDALFQAYPKMKAEVRGFVQSLFTPLVRALGPSNAKVLALLGNYPAGSEDLALRMLAVLTQHGKVPVTISTLIKILAKEKDLNPRFMVPIIADLDKAEILRQLPRIVSLLNGKPAEKELVRQVFQSVVTTPPQSFGSVTSNVARVRQSELLTPVELLALLHTAEKEIGIKQSIEAIGLCFSMTDAFRPEVLGAFMQQIVDEATLPTLFLRTVIQAVTTYKSLQPYVSNTLLSRLITKKVWTMPQLWQGFIRCAKVIAPNSFGAILQLPRDQIKEVVTKQPELKEGLKEFVIKKAGTNRARIAGLLEMLEE